MSADLLSLVELDGFRTVRKSTSRGGQYNGPCPWCQGTDRFRVQPHYGPYGFFACSQCGRSGSAVDYLMQKRGLSKQAALAEVGWTPQASRRWEDFRERIAAHGRRWNYLGVNYYRSPQIPW